MTTRPRKNLQAKDLLLSSSLASEQAATLLAAYGFKCPTQADANLQRMANEPRSRRLLADRLDQILTHLSLSTDPDVALSYFERFTTAAIDKVTLYTFLKAYPFSVDVLATTMGHSPFLSQILIRHPTYFYWLCDPDILRRERTKHDLWHECASMVDAVGAEDEKLDALRRFKRKEALRIGVRDLLKLSSLHQTMAALSLLAEAIVHHVYTICTRRLQARHGRPRHHNSVGRKVPTGFTVVAMGKLGGKELNFSSDIDLMYVFGSDDGATTGTRDGASASRVSNTEYFRRLSQAMTRALSEVTQDGYLFRVDLDLRPEGKSGDITTSLDAYRHYYANRGETWERMALLKARPIVGNRALGRRFLSAVSTFVHDPPFTASNLDQVKDLKARINKKLASRRRGGRNVKLGFGGIREIEFIVQSLQLAHGHQHHDLYDRHTINALRKLKRHAVVSRHDYRRLLDAYRFYRNVEHKLQMVDDLQTHTLPADLGALQRCALMMGYRNGEASRAASQLQRDDTRHARHVNEIFTHLQIQPSPAFASTREYNNDG